MSIRIKLTLGLIIIIILSNVLMAVITSLYVKHIYMKEVQTRVRMDLNSAREVYNNSIDQIEQVLKAISYRRKLSSPLAQEVQGELGVVLQKIFHETGVDMLSLIGNDGCVIFRAHNPGQYGDDVSEIPIIGKVLQSGKSAKGTMVISQDMLNKENTVLADRAVIRIKDTPKARQITKTIEERGFLAAAVVPLISFDDDRVLGFLMGAYLLNNDFKIVDEIKQQVFQDQDYKGKDIGTATIFFDDLRISTNVKGQDNLRAVGSRMSKEVYDLVIHQGKVWEDRAFVVNEWYITSYEPIYDPNEKIIGALYVGLLEEPFKIPQKVIIMFFIIMVSLSALATLTLTFFLTNKLLRPIDNILSMSKEVVRGNLQARSGIRPPGEMGQLCQSIDQMAEAIEFRENELRRITQEQISQSEKLASIGRLSAGIAHEINNPLTGILTFAHLIKQDKAGRNEDTGDAEVIIRETTRIQEIVRGLLDFARQSPSKKEYLRVNDILHQVLKLVRSQKAFKSYTIEENYKSDLPEVPGDKNQLQQLFFNIILNAGEAISGEGKISIETTHESGTVVVVIRDNGCGIKKEDLDKIFDPFYTTKPVGKGTGLGLSISYGIVEQHGGHITCESEEGKGTTFKIILPVKGSIRDEKNAEKNG